MPGLDINIFRSDKGYDPEIVRKSLQKRYKNPKIVDEIIDMDKNWRKIRFDLDTLKKQWNEIQNDIKTRKLDNKEDKCEELTQKKIENEKVQKQLSQKENELLMKINLQVNKCGNIVHQSVPFDDNEQNNEVVKKWGKIPQIKMTDKKGGLAHHKILELIGGFDPERGQKIAGHRGYFLKGYGVLLNNALISYGLQFLAKRQHTLLQPPYLMKKQIMSQCCQLSDFHEMLYQVTQDYKQYTQEEKPLKKQKKQQFENNVSYLIATSEQPISAMHRGQWIQQSVLPLKYGGISTCFRKQAGAHGKDNWGIFRTHQFEKVQQFMITKPQQSWKAHQQMIQVAQQFYQSLGLPYRVVNIVSGTLNDAASKKYDLEAWFPSYDTYRQLVSCSNCTDFQSRNLNIRCGTKKKQEKEKRYVHMLNATLCATQRTMCCILQNYQTETGVKIPKVLVPFVGTEFIPFIHEQKLGKQIKKQTQMEPELTKKQSFEKEKQIGLDIDE